MKKKLHLFGFVLGLSLLGFTGLLFNASKAEAAAYDPAYENYVPSKEANEQAIQVLKEENALENNPFPESSLTVDQPIEALQPTKLTRGVSNSRIYFVSEKTFIFNITQARIPDLAPTGFNWLENGIPFSNLSEHLWIKNQPHGYVTFKPYSVQDTGVGVWDQGYYWRKFNSAAGTFWASAWNLGDLLYQ